ncbi:hypothetical protein [Ruegeria sp. Ofav3-42]|uniref:hypothetical protein n=1 Tax=Ruegeria sp. Ofav3-42 TaxID=2917759 RepID=UPI001EF5A5D2|nr:hypothetical protein [Ruegeria sp. Ofav3-42]MCG7522136.1 hypothetical protein [Ruegeria sp. Ofav3-42]
MTNGFKSQAILLAVLLVLSILTYTKLGETIALLAAITLIGLPITVLIAALPTISAAIAVLIITQRLGRLVGLSFGWVFGALLCLGFYHLPEYILRPAAEAEAKAMLTQDTGWDGTFSGTHIALLGVHPGKCRRRCRDLLAEGVEAVFLTDHSANYWQHNQLSGEIAGLSFFMRSQGKCDPALDALRRAHSGVMVSRFDRDECFQAKPAILNDMDIAVWSGDIRRPAGTHWVETLRRARLFRRTTAGWQLAEQSSQVTYRSVTNAMLTREGGNGIAIQLDPGFNWKGVTIGPYPDIPSFKAGY